MPIRHGIFVTEPVTGARPINIVSSAVIGLVATASDADATLFPLNKPVLVTDVRSAIAKAGEQGTLADALSAIADQCSPLVVAVRVAPGVAAGDVSAQEATDLNVVGGSVAGAYTGMQALLAAEAQLGVRPRILGCPGLDTQDVTTALVVIAKKLRAMVYAACPGADDVSEAILYRGEFGDRELMLIYPDFTRFGGHAVAAALGLRAKIDEEIGWHKTLSNVVVGGVTGLSKDIFFDLQDPSTDAALLNDAPVTTLSRMNGYRFWGNRTCADEPKFAFESATRTAQILRDTIARGIVWSSDQPLTVQLLKDQLETINAAFRSLSTPGPSQRVMGAQAYIDPALNPAGQLAGGKIQIDYDFTPIAPAEDIQLNQRITDRFYVNVAGQVSPI